MSTGMVLHTATGFSHSVGMVCNQCPGFRPDFDALELADAIQEERDRIADAIEAMRTYACCGNFAPDYCETCRVTFEAAHIARTGGKGTTPPPGPPNPEDSP